MQNEIISQGFALMALGMGVVFVFLTLLVATTISMSAIISRYFPQTLSEQPSLPGNADATPDQTTITIIQEAIRQHRNA